MINRLTLTFLFLVSSAVSAESLIVGAFGQKLGAVVSPGLAPSDYNEFVYEFLPAKPHKLFDSYSVLVTPEKKEIALITMYKRLDIGNDDPPNNDLSYSGGRFRVKRGTGNKIFRPSSFKNECENDSVKHLWELLSRKYAGLPVRHDDDPKTIDYIISDTKNHKYIALVCNLERKYIKLQYQDDLLYQLYAAFKKAFEKKRKEDRLEIEMENF